MNGHPRARLVIIGAALGTVPGVTTLVVGILIGGVAAVSVGAIGILLAMVGAIVGGSVGAAIHGGGTHRTTLCGAIIGLVPGLATIPVQARLGLPVMLICGIAGAMVGSRLGHGTPGTPTR